MFSIPINPKFNYAQYNYFVDFLTKNKDVIYDLYFTCRMPPFVQDAMGDIITVNEQGTIDAAIDIQTLTGIRVSAVFNNIEVRPTQDNLDLFIINFRQLYAAGIRSVTIPHTHWVATGQLQKEFPDLEIKNTILRDVQTAKEVANAAREGFNYVNLHRDLMRDQEELKRCRKAADKYGIKLSLLANEGCAGGCPMMKEHFQFNNMRVDGPQYFNDPISRVSCSKWSVQDPSYQLKEANFPPWKEDWDELLTYVDVIKMHGRESISRAFETMKLVEKFNAGDEILYADFNTYLEDNHLVHKPITAWREKIKTCKFDCWDCNYCDKVYQAKSGRRNSKKSEMVTQVLVDHVNSDYDNNVQGLTSWRVKKLLHELSKNSNRFLEIGSALGATTLALLDAGTPGTCIDNWKENIQPEGGVFELDDNDLEQFKKNIGKHKPTIVHSDLLETSIDEKHDLFFYDGPKDVIQEAIRHYSKTWEDETVLVFDDANWAGIVQNVDEGLAETGFVPVFSKLVLNGIEDPLKWWNGLYILVVMKG